MCVLLKRLQSSSSISDAMMFLSIVLMIYMVPFDGVSVSYKGVLFGYGYVSLQKKDPLALDYTLILER